MGNNFSRAMNCNYRAGGTHYTLETWFVTGMQFFLTFVLCIIILSKFFYLPTNAQVIVLKTVLKFTLHQLRYVSVQSHHPQGVHYSCLLKLHLLK